MSATLTIRLASAAVLAGMAGSAWVAPAPQDPAPTGSGDFVLEAGTHDVRHLIERSAAHLGRNYVYSAADFANAPDLEVVLQNRLVLDAVGCEEVVAGLAYTKGFVMVPIDPGRGIYEWIHRAGPKRAEAMTRAVEMTPAEVMAKRKLCLPVRTAIPIEGVELNALQNYLRPFFAQGGGADTIVLGQTPQALLLAGYSNTVAGAIELIEKATGPIEQLDPGLLTWKTRVDQRLDALEKRQR